MLSRLAYSLNRNLLAFITGFIKCQNASLRVVSQVWWRTISLRSGALCRQTPALKTCASWCVSRNSDRSSQTDGQQTRSVAQGWLQKLIKSQKHITLHMSDSGFVVPLHACPVALWGKYIATMLPPIAWNLY